MSMGYASLKVSSFSRHQRQFKLFGIHCSLRCVVERCYSIFQIFKSTYFILPTYKGTQFGIYMLPFCGVPSMFVLRTRDHLQWVQIASDERHMGLTSISDEHQTSFKLDQVLVSYHIRRMRQGPHRSVLRVFRSEFTIIDLFTWLRLTSHGLRRCFRWPSKSFFSLPESV